MSRLGDLCFWGGVIVFIDELNGLHEILILRIDAICFIDRDYTLLPPHVEDGLTPHSHHHQFFATLTLLLPCSLQTHHRLEPKSRHLLCYHESEKDALDIDIRYNEGQWRTVQCFQDMTGDGFNAVMYTWGLLWTSDTSILCSQWLIWLKTPLCYCVFPL